MQLISKSPKYKSSRWHFRPYHVNDIFMLSTSTMSSQYYDCTIWPENHIHLLQKKCVCITPTNFDTNINY